MSATLENSTPACIAIERVSRRYARRKQAEIRALDGLSLEVQAGEWVALLGPNGSGKSTLLRMLAGLDRPDEGRVRVLDEAASSRSVAARRGVVSQRASLDALLTVRENLATQGALFGLRGRERAERVVECATRLGVADRLDDRVETLSGGLARRVDLARALVQRPTVLLLDEPTTELDHQSRMGFLDAIEALRSETMTIVMTTHLMDEAERADRVAMLDQGRLVADDTPSRLRQSYAGRIVRCTTSTPDELTEARSILEGVEVDDSGAHEIRAVLTSDESDRAERIVGAMARAGLSFEIGPPTLADAYLAFTGRSLAEESGP
jgi:ABC-2 type transport system ATP-binding protein